MNKIHPKQIGRLLLLAFPLVLFCVWAITEAADLRGKTTTLSQQTLSGETLATTDSDQWVFETISVTPGTVEWTFEFTRTPKEIGHSNMLVQIGDRVNQVNRMIDSRMYMPGSYKNSGTLETTDSEITYGIRIDTNTGHFTNMNVLTK